MPTWSRSRWVEVVFEVAVLIVLPIWNIIKGIIDDESAWLILVTTLGTLALVLFIIAGVRLAWPKRRAVLKGKELMDTIDVWLREAGYARGNANPIPNYDRHMYALIDGQYIFLNLMEDRNLLSISASRVASDADDVQLNAMPPKELIDLLYEFRLELIRFGAFVTFNQTGQPFSITEHVNLQIDASFDVARLLDRVEFVRRADTLIQLTAYRRMTASLVSSHAQGAGQTPMVEPSPPSAPDTPEDQQSATP